MKNLIQPGNVLTVAAPYNVSGGQGVLLGGIFGVAAGDALNGEDVDIHINGVFALAKPSTAIFAAGANVYFDTATKTCRSGNDEDSNSAGDFECMIGSAVKAAGAGATTVNVLLHIPVELA